VDSEHKRELVQTIADALQKFAGQPISFELVKQRCDAHGRLSRNLRDALAFRQKTTGTGARKRFRDVVNASKTLAGSLREVPRSVTGPPFDTEANKEAMLAELKRLAEWGTEAAEKVQIDKARNVHGEYSSALCAYSLMTSLSKRKITAAPEGAFIEISSLLHELFTGETHKNFDAVCRKICKKHKLSLFPWQQPRPRGDLESGAAG
jgi:hypothetical protein